MERLRSGRRVCVVAASIFAVLVGGASGLLGVCGPFTDVAADSFCPFVLELFTLGITTGTTPTTYDPTGTVNRLQMAAFLSRSVDGALKRGSRRAALNQFWRTEANSALAQTTVGASPLLPVSDGEDVWVPTSGGSGAVWRVHGSDGRTLGTWTGATNITATLAAMGKIFATGTTNPGRLYRIDPGQAPGAVTTVASTLGGLPEGLTYDGSRIWTTNLSELSGKGSISIVTPGASIPWTVTTVTTGFEQYMFGILYDGANVWATNLSVGTLLKLDSAANILQTVTLGATATYPIFDGSNIWVPNDALNAVSVVRASNGAILATLTGNGLSGPQAAAFDGQRILVVNHLVGADSVSLWKAADLTPIGSFPTGTNTSPFGACSDGINFWITLVGGGVGRLARF